MQLLVVLLIGVTIGRYITLIQHSELKGDNQIRQKSHQQRMQKLEETDNLHIVPQKKQR